MMHYDALLWKSYLIHLIVGWAFSEHGQLPLRIYANWCSSTRYAHMNDSM